VFDEPINTTLLQGGSVYVATGTPSSHTNVALDATTPISWDSTGTVLTINTADALPVNGQFVVQILKETVQDLSGNLVTTSGSPSYVSFVTSSSGGVFLTLNLKTSSTTN